MRSTQRPAGGAESRRPGTPGAGGVATGPADGDESFSGVVAVGVGCSLGCPADELCDLVDAALAEAGVSHESVAVMASVDRRAGEPGVVEAAARRGWSLRTFTAAALAAIEVPTPSPAVAAHVGTPSVAEAAALLAAGPGAAIVVPKRRSARATCALACAGGGGPA